MSSETTALLVLGMHRSGTSATSGALGILGFELGRRLVTAADDNPKGYFEHEAVVQVHEHFLEALGRRWCDPTPMPVSAWHGPNADEARASIRAIIRDDFATATRWALKDPRLSRLLPLWEPLWPEWGIDPAALLVLRSPGEVAASLARRDGFPPMLSSCLWLTHVIEALEGCRGRRLACVDYGRLVAAPTRALARALETIGAEVGDGLREGSALTAFVDPSLNHHAAEAPTATDAFSALAADVHSTLAANSEEAAPLDPGPLRAAYDAVWASAGAPMEAGVAAFRSSVQSASRWRDIAFSAKSDLAAQVRWSDEAVQVATALRERIQALECDAQEALRLEAALRKDLDLADRIAREREAERDALLVQRHETSMALEALVAERDELAARNADLAQQLQDIMASRSWRWTAPLRNAARRIQRKPE